MTLPLIIAGAFGRMGREVIELSLKDASFHIEGGIVRPGTDLKKPADWRFPIYDNLEACLKSSPKGVVIDFSTADLLHDHLSAAKKAGCGLLIATTGHTQASLSAIKKTAEEIPIVLAPNTSLMMCAMLCCAEFITATIGDLSASIIDLHHRRKKDAPSGTANALKNAINAKRPAMEVDIHSLRQGDVVGEHTLYFFSKFERLEITHRAEDRRIFAQGALVAAQFLFERAPGLYTMKDVLNMNLTIQNEDCE